MKQDRIKSPRSPKSNIRQRIEEQDFCSLIEILDKNRRKLFARINPSESQVKKVSAILCDQEIPLASLRRCFTVSSRKECRSRTEEESEDENEYEVSAEVSKILTAWKAIVWMGNIEISEEHVAVSSENKKAVFSKEDWFIGCTLIDSLRRKK